MTQFRKPVCMFIALVLHGCASYSDVVWEIHPGEATDSIAIDHEPGDVVCVRELGEGSEVMRRTCVPAVTDEESGGDK